MFPASLLANSQLRALSTYLIIGNPWSRAPWCSSSSLCLANPYPSFKTQLKCHLLCEAFPQQSRQNSVLLCVLSTHTHSDFHLDLIILQLTLIYVLLSKQPPPTNSALSLYAFDLKTSHGNTVRAGCWSTLQQPHPLLLPEVALMLTKISFIFSQTSL